MNTITWEPAENQENDKSTCGRWAIERIAPYRFRLLSNGKPCHHGSRKACRIHAATVESVDQLFRDRGIRS